jgi:hypothetical protein
MMNSDEQGLEKKDERTCADLTVSGFLTTFALFPYSIRMYPGRSGPAFVGDAEVDMVG